MNNLFIFIFFFSFGINVKFYYIEIGLFGNNLVCFFFVFLKFYDYYCLIIILFFNKS